jgi:surfactin family lipopeptide synthetase A
MSRSVFPASFAQQRLWFLDQFEPGTAAYNLPRVFRITGPLNVDCMTRAFQTVIQRHASLRTVFDSVDGEARQIVLPEIDFNVPIIDLTDIPQAQREAEGLRIAREEGMRPFDLCEGPLLRASLMRLGSDHWIMLLVMHHIVTDGWSISRLFRDVTKSYAAFLEKREPELPELPIQYAEYAQWQREHMSGEVVKREIEHWRTTLAGAQTLLDLPTDYPRPPAQTWHGADKGITLDRATLAKMKSLAQKQGSTLFMVSMAAFQTLLWRYTHQESILVGTPVASRNHVEVEDVIGLFVNTLVFRTDFTSDPSFRDLIQGVRSFALEAYNHQDVPFEKLVEALVPQRSLETSPLFQVMFIFQNIPKQIFEISGLSIKELNFETGIANFDLTAEVWEDKGELHCQFEYNTDLFEHSTIEQMLRHFERLVASALKDPDLPVLDLPMMSARERNQILLRWNQTETDHAAEDSEWCIHELFESQAERSPDAVAVVAGDQELTYSELNHRANQLAWHLLKRGVGPEVPVGLCVDRGLGMVVALLGILKAGGAYVPLDSRLPDDRLSFMVADAKPRIVVTERKLQREVLGAGPVLLDSDWKVIANESKENPSKKLSPKTLAYVMYTSGSTGKPKGVPIEHRNVVNLLRSMQREPGLGRDDVLLAVTTLSFDIAGLEIYLPLISGARLVIASSQDVVDGNRLKDLLSENQITFMQATPSTWRLLLGAGWEGSPDLTILCGGESLPPELARELSARACSVWNVYGPTETTIWSSAYRVTGQEKGPIPIGRPLANTSIYILDSRRNPVPINIRGEIYIGGDGVARGYLNRPELTAERFVANTVVPKQSSILYRTGDLGRFRSTGDIDYLGRVDSQVKLRGQRIELGEIESVLASHESIKEAVVIMTGQGEQQKLSAYVVGIDGKPAAGAGELRRYLRTKLPEHMVPAGYWQLNKLPLLPSGKIDRRSLPGSSAIALEEAALVEPRNEVEAKLAEIWKELLQVEHVGIEQNFFELGGHSLLALQLTARIRRALEIDLPVRTVFEAPTIAAMAPELEKARATGRKGQPSIPRRQLRALPADSTQEALLVALRGLSVEEARKLIENAVGRKTEP